MRILYDSVPETSLTVQVYPFDNDTTRFVEVALLVYYVGARKHWLPPQVKPCRMTPHHADEAKAIEQATSRAALIAGHLCLAADPEHAFKAMQMHGASPEAFSFARRARRFLRPEDVFAEGSSILTSR